MYRYEVEGSKPIGRPEDVERGCAKRLPTAKYVIQLPLVL